MEAKDLKKRGLLLGPVDLVVASPSTNFCIPLVCNQGKGAVRHVWVVFLCVLSICSLCCRPVANVLLLSFSDATVLVLCL